VYKKIKIMFKYVFSLSSKSYLGSLRYLGINVERLNRLNKLSYRSYRHCCAVIVNHYQNRQNEINTEILFSSTIASTLLEPLYQSNATLTHHVDLTVRPDEFEKLPPKCSACGVILQTENGEQLGFIPQKKVLNAIEKKRINNLTCYDCYQLRFHNKVSPVSKPHQSEIYDQIRHLRQRKALVLYVIDIFDIEGSIVTNLLSLIGQRKRVIIVANKMDRIPRDDPKAMKQMEHMKDIVKTICIDNGLAETNFRDICLVSGKTGFGLHTLVQKINKHRDVNMDVYLVGTANTGKSTLYNLIINMLNAHKEDERLPNQAIEHHTPGTTVALLREPISMRRLHRLQYRLNNAPWKEEEGFDFDDELLEFLDVKDKTLYKTPPTLLHDGSKSVAKRSVELVDDRNRRRGVKDKQNYIFDTPGIMHTSSLLQYLRSDEIKYLTPDQWIVPRTIIMKPGNCLFIGGLARLDYQSIWRPELDNVMEKATLAQSAESIYVTVMASPNLPLHLTQTEGADEKYSRLFLNKIFQIPNGTEERLNEFPRLSPHTYTVIGQNLNVNSSDLLLHGVGWFSIAAVNEGRVQLALHTPNGLGQCLRNESLLPYTVRKKCGRGISYLGRSNNKMYGHTRKLSPSFVRVFQQQNDPVYSWKTKIFQKQKQERFLGREEQRLERIESGVVLGKWRAIKENEERLKLLIDN